MKTLDSHSEIGVSSVSQYTIRAVDRTLDILDTLMASHEPVDLSDLSARIKVPKSSAFRYLVSLEQRGYVVRAADRESFTLADALQPLGPTMLIRLVAVAHPVLNDLLMEFEETVNLGVLHGSRVAYVEILESPMAVRFAARVGDQAPLHSSAIGKAIAAGLSPHEIQRVLTLHGMQPLTAQTIVDPTLLTAELDRVRQAGYAVDDGEDELGGRCVGVSIGGLNAAISVSAPKTRLPLSRVPEIAVRLKRAASSIAAEIARPDA